MQKAERRYPWQPWKREPPGTFILNRFRGDTYLREYLAEKILTKTPGRKGGEGARIRNDSQEGKN